MNKLIHGVGYNSKRKHKTEIDGKSTEAYKKWRSMIARCYSDRYQETKPTYKDCTVCEEWHDFQNFADWLEGHDYGGFGYALDKDILNSGNKKYSPSTCCLVPLSLNTLITDGCLERARLLQGVQAKKSKLGYRARISINGKTKHLGYFDCPNEAHQAYKKAKEAYVKEKAIEWRDRIAEDVFLALLNWTL